ncbi:MAG: hypothetical protein HN975_02005 [Anaerolineae bacterium]|jgi:hypothetical protein|nr:hypothetical protein [Anaerolineae bacterium]
MTCNLINDGYTKDAYIKPFDGVHDGMTFKYRPMLPNEVTRYESKIDKCPAGDQGNITAGVIAIKLVEWSEETKDKKPVPIDYDNVRKVPYDLLATMIGIIKGTRPCDEPPGKNSHDSYHSNADDICEEGDNPGVRLLEEQGKNSS